VSLTTGTDGLPAEAALLPLQGTLAEAPQVVSMSSNITTNSSNNSVGQVVPTDVTITGISASFVNNVALFIADTTITLDAQIYISNDGGATYGAFGDGINLNPALIESAPVGTISSAAFSFPIGTIPAGDLCVVVVTASATGFTLANSVVGSVTVGVTYTTG
jgi:hypothetical protein